MCVVGPVLPLSSPTCNELTPALNPLTGTWVEDDDDEVAWVAPDSAYAGVSTERDEDANERVVFAVLSPR